MPSTKTRGKLPATMSSERSNGVKRGRKKGSRNKFHGYPIVDATEVFVVPLLQVDVEKAQAAKTDDVNDKGNFLGCVVNQACTRVGGEGRVAIMRKHAYVLYPGDGRALRYVVDGKSRKIIEAWDRGEHIVEGVELRLLPPTKAHTLPSQRRYSKKYRKRNPGSKRKTGRTQRNLDPLAGTVRNGNMVRF